MLNRPPREAHMLLHSRLYSLGSFCLLCCSKLKHISDIGNYGIYDIIIQSKPIALLYIKKVISHASTNQARLCLASEIRKDWAYLVWYGYKKYNSSSGLLINAICCVSSQSYRSMSVLPQSSVPLKWQFRTFHLPPRRL